MVQVEQIETDLSVDRGQGTDKLSEPLRGTPKRPNVFRIYNLSLIQNAVRTITLDGFDIEYWIVSVPPLANQNIRVYPDQSNNGDVLPLGTGGNLKIPMMGPYLTVENLGSAETLVTVLAVSNYEVTFSPTAA